MSDFIPDNPNRIIAVCERSPMRLALEFWIMTADRRAFGRSVVMEKVDPSSVVDPTFRLDYSAAQVLIDELWRCGFRPTEGHGSAGQLAATERHLEDARGVASRLLDNLIGRDAGDHQKRNG